MSGANAPLAAVLGTPSGLKCPRCQSENCEAFAWASNYFSRDDAAVPEIWYEPDTAPAAVAQRCAKPAFPKAGLAWRAADGVLSFGALGLAFWLTQSVWIAVVPAVLVHILMFVLWSRFVGKKSLDQHHEDVEAWKQGRLCMDCGQVFAL